MAGYEIDQPGLGNLEIEDIHNRPDLVPPPSPPLSEFLLGAFSWIHTLSFVE